MTANLSNPNMPAIVSSPAPTASRVDSHVLVILAILLTAAALTVFLGRIVGLGEQGSIASSCGFALLALLGHLAVSRVDAQPRDASAKHSSRGRASAAKQKTAASATRAKTKPTDSRREPVLPPPSGEPSLDVAVDLAAFAALPTVTSPGQATPGSWQAEISRAMPSADSRDHLEPRLSIPPALPTSPAVNASKAAQRPASTIDENEVQRVEKLVRQLAENVRILEQSAPANGRPSVARAKPNHSLPPNPSTGSTLANSHLPAPNGVAATPNMIVGTPHDPSAADQIAATRISENRIMASQMAMTLAAALAPEPVPAETALQAATTRPDHGGIHERDEIIAALNAQRIDVFLEPILDIKDQRPQHFEVSIAMRTASGDALDLARAETHLGGTGLLPLLDQTRIVQAANLADRLAGLGKTGSVLTRLHGETLSNEGFRHSFASGQRTIGAYPRHLVLSLPQVEVAHFTNADWQTLARLSAAGFGFAITSITTLDMDFQGLVSRGFVIARLDADTFLNGLPAEGMRIPPGDICRHFAACGLSLVVGHIDDDQQLARIFGFGVVFGQGQVFGGPRAVNPDAQIRHAATPGLTNATA